MFANIIFDSSHGRSQVIPMENKSFENILWDAPLILCCSLVGGAGRESHVTTEYGKAGGRVPLWVGTSVQFPE